MAASSAVAGFGTLLIWNYHRILEIGVIGGPSESKDVIDISNNDSDDGYREFVAGPGSGGEISLEGNLITTDANGQVAFYTDLQGGTPRTAWIVPPMAVAEALTIEAIAKGFAPSYPHDNKIGVSGSLQVTGKPSRYTTQSAGMSGLTGIEETGPAGLEITPAIAVGTYAYNSTTGFAASTWVKLTITAADHTIYVNGVAQTSGVQGEEIALGDAGTDTEIFIFVYEAAKSPRLYVLTVTRLAA